MGKDLFYKSQCLFHALDVARDEGGYICFGMSTHYDLQHCGNYNNLTGEFASFVPPADLSNPLLAPFGFWGSVVIGDKEHRRPMTPKLMWRGIMALVLGFWVWRIKRYFDEHWPIP